MGSDKKRIDKLESDISESIPYLASDEKSSTLKDRFPEGLVTQKGQRLLEKQLEKEKEDAHVKPWVHFVAGGLGGMCGAIFTSPFDVVKTRLQSSVYREAYRSHAGSYSFLRSMEKHFEETCMIIYKVYQVEGPRALFKGLGPNLVGVIPARSINFFTYGYTKDLLKQTQYFAGEETSFMHMLAGLNAGIVTSTATNPIWLIKTRLQLDKATTKEYKNSFDCLSKIVRREGFSALYKGLSASYLGSAESTIQWILYEQMKSMINRRAERFAAGGKERTRVDDVADWFARSGAAGFAKLIASLITYPHEVVRTRLRQAPMENGKPKYTGLIQCFKLVFKEEGFVSMYGGLTPHLMRTVPNSMIMFGTWELFTKALSKL
ncbi:DEKNAAC102141 [Brettanomyces naardenensis]|uniref:DEKNAAC102141 n=1 Tax=Brettanomyces naardenensis TaxID=13370 RepID=A0A448YJW7_BRENA|nr:DEKNAAC102141 [Brettanomyces naardenensis]